MARDIFHIKKCYIASHLYIWLPFIYFFNVILQLFIEECFLTLRGDHLYFLTILKLTLRKKQAKHFIVFMN